MKDILLTMLTVLMVLTISIMAGVYHHPDDEIKQMIDTNRVIILIFYGTWIYCQARRGKK